MNLHPQNCSLFSSLTTKSLCQTLSKPVKRTKQSPISFTGLPAADIIILNELSDTDLINVCASNKYLNHICNNESFWFNKVLNKYSSKLGSGKEIRDKYMLPGTTWKEYYLWLSNMENDVMSSIKILINYDREDLLILHKDILTKMFFVSNPKYFAGLNLGYSIPNAPNSTPINQMLAISQIGLANLRLLKNIIYLYEKNNGPDPNIASTIIDMIVPFNMLSEVQKDSIVQNEIVYQLRLNQEIGLTNITRQMY